MVDTTDFPAVGPQKCRLGPKGMRTAFCLLASLVWLLPGCASWEPAMREAPAQETGSLSFMRSPTEEGRQLGLDPQAREIERSLGIR